ncbi:MAG: hypothetical protein KDK91_24430, partial [Gammaproteobacteria bacterium]|nr:hypothetical protein [Gammaproteobacteria bacterium]
MKPVPNSKARRIIERLNALDPAESGNSFLLRRLEQEARAALGQDPVSGYGALRTIATLRFDEEQMRVAARHAIRLSDFNAPEPRLEFSYALRTFGCLLEASQQAEQASRAAPRNAVAAEVCARFAFYAGCVREARRLIERYATLRPDVTLPYSYMVERLVKALDVAEISDAVLSDTVEAAMSMVRAARPWPIQMSNADRDPGRSSNARFVLRLRLGCSVDQARTIGTDIDALLDSHP